MLVIQTVTDFSDLRGFSIFFFYVFADYFENTILERNSSPKNEIS